MSAQAERHRILLCVEVTMLTEKDQKRIEKLVDTFIAADAAEKTAREIKDKVREELNRYHLDELWEARDIKHTMKCHFPFGNAISVVGVSV